jgi:autotransporter-associated beta strand protein
MKKNITLPKRAVASRLFRRLTTSSLFILTIWAAKAQTFVHPGIPFTRGDLDLLKTNITKEPWLSAYNAFASDSHSQLSYSAQGPDATVTRAPNLNNTHWQQDMIAVHHLAFMWWFTGNIAYAQKATTILDAWAVTNTTWGGTESMLDIGDYAQYWGTGAEILRYTYPGWTQANTDHVKNYFTNVLFPTSYVPYQLRDANKGALQLKIALAASVFCDDIVRFNQAIDVYRMDAGGGMRNSLKNGEIGDSGRDDHWRVQAAALVWGAEVAYKQGIDMYEELDKRVLALGELYNRYSFQGDTIKFIPFGGYSSFWLNWGIPTGFVQSDYTNILKGAYELRKGIPVPFNEQMRAKIGGAGGDFLYLKSADTSTAHVLPQVYYPADHVNPATALTNTDIGNPGLAGSAVFNNATWTIKGAGNSAANSVNYTFRKLNGNAGLVIKVTGMSVNTAATGVMIRESLAPTANYWNLSLAATGGVGPHGAAKMPWWLKIERVGTRIFTYHSPDGVNWTSLNAIYSTTYPDNLYYGFYTVSNNTSSLNTATLTDVGFSQSSAAGSPEISSATTATATIGQNFSYQITASNNPDTFLATGLPAGLTLNTSTGLISGAPTALSVNEVTIGAVNTAGSGQTTLMLNVVNSQAPPAPASLIAQVINSAQVKLNWANSPNATSYNIKRSTTAGGPYTTIQEGVLSTTFTDAAPVPEVFNYYVVTAMSGNLESSVSNEVSSSVPPATPDKPTITNKDNSVDISWPVANGASTYNLKRAVVSGGPYTTISNVSSNSYTDNAVTNSSPYYYVISSVGSKSESANSAEAFAVPGSTTLTWSSDAETTNLSEATNWVEDTSPKNPAIILFKSSADTVLNNDITGLEASRIQFDQDAPAYSIGGNGIILNNDLVNNSVKVQTISTPLIINKQLFVSTNTGNIALTGTISGASNITKSGVSNLVLSGPNTFSGGTVIKGALGAWPPVCGIILSGTSAGTASNPVSGPLGTGKITFNGGAIWSEKVDATIYNDIEIPAGQTGWIFQTSNAVNLYGKLTGSGTLQQDGNTTAGLHLFADNSSFTGKFVSRLRSGNSRTRFEVPQAGSASADWLLDANGTDCQSLQFNSGTINFGSLSGRGYIRNNGGGAPVISIGALNNDSNFGGTIANSGSGNVQVQKVGTGTLTFGGNSIYGGNTTIKNGKFFLSNSPTTGVFASPIIDSAGVLGGTGVSQAAMTVGTGTAAVTSLEPGNNAIGTLATTNTLTMNGNATFKVEISSKSATNDMVQTGTVKLVGSPQLAVADIDPGSLPTGSNLTIMNNTGTAPVSGIFKNLPELTLINVGNYAFRITYKGGTGNDVVLLDDRTIPIVITSAATDTILVGKTMSFTITAIKSPTRFGASGLPAGLQIDSLSGKISGTPTESGIFNISLTAGNGSTTSTSTLVLTILNSAVNSLIVAAGDAKNILEWKSIPGFTYNVKRSTTSGGPYTTVGSVNNLTFTDSSVSNGTTYFYVVSPSDSTGEGTKSTEVVAKPNIAQRGFYQFDEASDTRGIDAWGANHAVLAATANRATGKYGKSLLLDGSANAYATLPAGIFSTLNDFTISAWVRMDAISTWMRVFDFGSSTTQYMFLTVQAAVTNGQSTIRYAIKNGSAAEQNINYNYTFSLNTWTYLAVTRTGNTTTLYVNGTSVTSSTNITIKPSALGSTTQNYLGKSQFADPMFKGSIDNFKIYGRALSNAEIAADMLGDQTINFASINNKTFGDADFIPPATASSGLPVSYASTDTAIASVVNGAIHIKAAGTATITASQSGNNSFRAATPINQSFTVGKKAQTITFNPIAAKTLADSDFVAGATASSELAVGYISSDSTVVQIIAGKLHITGSGTAVITASQNGNAYYLPASPVTQALTVNKLSQSISFAGLPLSRPGDADISLSATSTSGLPVVYTSSNLNVATIINNKLHIVGAGNSAITVQQGGNARFDTTALIKTFTVLPYNVLVKSVDGDNGQVSNNAIKPYFQIVNQDSVALKYSELTVRYWFTPENFAGINTWVDYAQIGNNNVGMRYVPLTAPASGALGYVEYSFSTGASLPANNNSGIVQSRLANQDWSNFAESDDYSYRSNVSSYAANDHITLYRNGVLIYGAEPASVPANTSLTVSYQNQNQTTTGNAISTYLIINNTGNLPVGYGDLAVRYWFSKEGLSSLNFSLDFAKIGNSRINSQFVSTGAALTGADTYLELTVDPSAGLLYPLSNSGNIQYRINKSDWSVFNEANDYSYLPKGQMALNNHITVYYKNQLIYGNEPTAGNNSFASGLPIKPEMIQNNDPSLTNTEHNLIYPNPVRTGRFSVKLTPDLADKDVRVVIRDNFGKVMQTGNYRGNNGSLDIRMTRNYVLGVYFVQLNELTPLRLLVNQ